MPVKVITSLQELKDTIKGDSDKAVVINFWASWCPPCRIIAPYFEQLSNAAPDIIFCEVNVDDVGNVAKSQEFDIRAIPTFIYFKGGKKIEESTGADTDAVKALVSQAENDLRMM